MMKEERRYIEGAAIEECSARGLSIGGDGAGRGRAREGERDRLMR